MSKLALPMAALAFCCWCVYLGGLASVQSMCMADSSAFQFLTMATTCSTALRYWWFVMSIEFFVVACVLALAAIGKLESYKNAFLGLTAVCMLLYIQASDMSMMLLDRVGDRSNDYYPLHRARTFAAGSIMTATANGLLIIALGISDHAHPAGEPSADKTAAAAV